MEVTNGDSSSSELGETALKVGIISGTGLDDPKLLTDRYEKTVTTPYGEPSDKLICGKIGNVDCVLLARHNRRHGVSPSQINYRANIFALAQAGCTVVLVTTACGSLREHIHPGHVVIPDQFIDRTYRRECTFYDGEDGHLPGCCHIAMGQPFCEPLRELLIETVKHFKIPCHERGTVITIEGPRFSTRAESIMFRSWNADIVNMTSVPEVVLANELGLPYAAVALPTDYDSWHDDADNHVDVDVVRTTMHQNGLNAVKILERAIKQLASMDLQDTIQLHKKRAKTAVFS